MKRILTATAAVVLCASAAQAQVAPVPPVAPAASAASPAAVLRTGTKVPLKLSEELTTKGKKLRVGQRFQLEVAEAVFVDGQMVIPVGSPAVGEITEVRNKGMWGKSGHLTAQVLYATVNGRQIRLNATFDDKGVTGTAGVIGAIALVPIAGFFMTGTSAVVPLGAPVTAFVGEDVTLSFAAPAPMVVTPTPVEVPVAAPIAAPVQAKMTTAVATK
jgi:hypothetical protein